MYKYNTVLIKPSSGLCNMKCTYCFYHDEMLNREIKYNSFMNINTLENIISKFLANTSNELNLVFQGGEPLLIGIDYYNKLIEIVNKYNTFNIKVNYSIQTNGLLIDEEFSKFFKTNNFLVGISLDGIKDIHDKYRIDLNNNPTYDRVIDSIRLLEKYNVEYNILTVVSKDISKRINDIYLDYKLKGFKYTQFIPLIDNINDNKGSKQYSINNEQLLSYLIKLFDHWYNDLINDKRWYHRYFDSLFNLIATGSGRECTMDNKCSIMYSIESNGDTYPCDFYMTDSYLLGNINNDTIFDIDKNRFKINFIHNENIAKCIRCKYYRLCMGGCKRDKVDGVNFYCSSYYKFFEYSYPKYMKLIELLKEHKI